jgi:DNA-binding MarR family transcriptional regulator
MNRSTAERDQLASTGDACGSPAGAAAATTRIRELLNRRELAATRHRLAIRRGMTLDEPEMLALAHLALDGHLTPSQLRHSLGYSSGGITAVVRRLERDGHITRHANPSDGRSRLIRPAPAVARAAAAGFAPLVAATNELITKCSEDEQRIIESFLDELLQITDEHARRLLDPRSPAHPRAFRIPALWA